MRIVHITLTDTITDRFLLNLEGGRFLFHYTCAIIALSLSKNSPDHMVRAVFIISVCLIQNVQLMCMLPRISLRCPP